MKTSAPSGNHKYDQLPVQLLQSLIRFDTTNPPGNEKECVVFIDTLLSEAGFDTILLSKDPDRPNLVARLAGRGAAPPLLLYGHVDVVTTEGQQWAHPPFEGKIVDEYLWGRGAVDMKGGVAMMLSALLRARADGVVPAGDVIFAALSDEESGGDFGAKFLVEEHPDQFADVRFALGEFGGFTFRVGGIRFYPVQVAEKQMCWMKAATRGPEGHGSLPVFGGAMAKMGNVLRNLDTNRLPIHISPPTRKMIESMAAVLPFPTGNILRLILVPRLTDSVLRLLGEKGTMFRPLVRNTVNATMVQGGSKINVIPSEISIEMDGRLLPGFGPDDMICELRRIVSDDVELEVVRHDSGPSEPDMGLFDTLAQVLSEADPGSVPVPFIVSGVTDARFFSRLGIQTYGFTPMNLPSDFAFMDVFHAADERIPVKAVSFGAEAMYRVIQRYGAVGDE